MTAARAWVTYMLACADSTFYVGSTTDVVRRVEEHNSSPKGAKYTKSRRPVSLVYTRGSPSRSAAQKHEAALKRLSHEEKRLLAKA